VALFEHIGPEDPLQLGEAGPQPCDRVNVLITAEGIDQAIKRNEPARLDQKPRKQKALLAIAQLKRAGRVSDLQRPQNPKVEHPTQLSSGPLTSC